MLSRSLPRSRVLAAHWPAIDRAVTRSLGDLGECDGVCKSALGSIDIKNSMLGCGYWGCAYPTIYTGWAVKISVDPIEGPITAAVMDDPVLRNHPGVAYVVDVWRLPEKVRWGRSPWRNVWVILREDITPLPRSRWTTRTVRATQLLNRIQDVAARLNYYERDSGAHKSAEQTWRQLIERARRTSETQLVADFMSVFHARTGGALADIHWGNVGTRQHDLSDISPGHTRSRSWIIFDVGHSSVDLQAEVSEVPKVPNPAIKVLPCHGFL